MWKAILKMGRTPVPMTQVSIEEVSKFWDRQPCNVRHGIALVGSKEWSEQVTARRYFVEPHIIDFAQFSRWEGKQVLEVGCGIGTDTLEFAKVGAIVTAIDLSAESVKLAFKRAALIPVHSETCVEFALNRVAFGREDAEEWIPPSWPDCTGFDLAYSFGVIHHTPHPEKVVANIYERLKPGAEFRLMLYAKWSIKNLFHQQPEAQAGCPVVKTFTARSVKKLLKDFEILSIRKTHIFPWRVKDYIEYNYVKEWYYRWMPAWMFNLLQRALGWHLLIVARKPSPHLTSKESS